MERMLDSGRRLQRVALETELPVPPTSTLRRHLLIPVSSS